MKVQKANFSKSSRAKENLEFLRFFSFLEIDRNNLLGKLTSVFDAWICAWIKTPFLGNNCSLLLENDIV